jgi:amino acid transporter
MAITSLTKRPRNVNAFQAAAILYGDWGTSKAYVIGLAFALAGYSSFWYVAGVCVLMVLVGLNYISICKFSPSGGGVYASARKHSEVLALVGAFFLLADYLITISLSALSCYMYLGVIHPVYWAIGSIMMVGVINFFGPKHSGNLA